LAAKISKKKHKINLFNEYLGYEPYNIMHNPGIKLNELTKIKC
jgi:hypothetical protein